MSVGMGDRDFETKVRNNQRRAKVNGQRSKVKGQKSKAESSSSKGISILDIEIRQEGLANEAGGNK
jgi:hypothetical protein